MRQKIWMAVAATVLAVVVNRMVVAGRGLKGQKLRFRHGARWNVKRFAEDEILEVAGGAEPVGSRIEGLGHGASARELKDRSGRGAPRCWSLAAPLDTLQLIMHQFAPGPNG